MLIRGVYLKLFPFKVCFCFKTFYTLTKSLKLSVFPFTTTFHSQQLSIHNIFHLLLKLKAQNFLKSLALSRTPMLKEGLCFYLFSASSDWNANFRFVWSFAFNERSEGGEISIFNQYFCRFQMKKRNQNFLEWDQKKKKIFILIQLKIK